MQANEEILRKIQADTMQAISDVTHTEYDSRNSSAVRLDIFQRDCLCKLHNWVKQVSDNSRGAWFKKPAKVFQKMHSQTFSEGQRCLLKDVSSNSFRLLPNPENLESSLLSEVHRESQLLGNHNNTQDDQRFSFFTKLLSPAKLSELAPIQKSLLSELAVDGIKPQRKIIIECEGVALLKALEKRPCSLVMTNYELVVIYDAAQQKTQSTIFFFQWKVDN